MSMTRITTLTLLGLGYLLAVPSIAHARYEDGMNLYQYVRSNPARFVDPLGLQYEFGRNPPGPMITAFEPDDRLPDRGPTGWPVDPDPARRWAPNPGGGYIQVRGGFPVWPKPEPAPAAKRAVKCPGGEWYVGGSITAHHYVVAGHSRAMLKFMCKKGYNVGHWLWCCGEGITVKQQVYKVATACGVTGSFNVGPGLGLSRLGVSGSVEGAESARDLHGHSVSLGWNVTAVVGVVSGDVGPRSHRGGGGIGTSFGLAASLVGSLGHTEIMSKFYTLLDEDSDDLRGMRLRGRKCVKKAFVEHKNPKIVDNPVRPPATFRSKFD